MKLSLEHLASVQKVKASNKNSYQIVLELARLDRHHWIKVVIHPNEYISQMLPYRAALDAVRIYCTVYCTSNFTHSPALLMTCAGPLERLNSSLGGARQSSRCWEPGRRGNGGWPNWLENFRRTHKGLYEIIVLYCI